MRFTLRLYYRKSHRKYLLWDLRNAWIIVNIRVNIYDNYLWLLYGERWVMNSIMSNGFAQNVAIFTPRNPFIVVFVQSQHNSFLGCNPCLGTLDIDFSCNLLLVFHTPIIFCARHKKRPWQNWWQNERKIFLNKKFPKLNFWKISKLNFPQTNSEEKKVLKFFFRKKNYI